MKINFNFYKGKTDTQQTITDEIENIIQTEEEIEKLEKLNEILPLTPLRENVLDWYPIKENATILEIKGGYGEITSYLCNHARKVVTIEERRENAQIIAQRNFKKNNLEIIVGKIQEIQLKEKFDYIIIVDETNRLEEYIKYSQNYLEEDGKIIIIVNNKFGMHAFATCELQEQIIRNDENTISKKAIDEILERQGLKYTKYYYPMPDYKLANVIFTDKQLPDGESIGRSLVYKEGLVNFGEVEAYTHIIKNDPTDFPYFANSYFIETAKKEYPDNEIKFVSFTNLRKKEKRVKTTLTEKCVYKKNANEESKQHLEDIKRNIDLLNKLGIKILDSYDGEKIISQYGTGKTLDKIILQEVKARGKEIYIQTLKSYMQLLKNKLQVVQNPEKNIFDKYEIEYEKSEVQNLTFVKHGFFDLTFQNCFYPDEKLNNIQAEKCYFYDQEWYEENVPVEFIIYRAILYNIEIKKYISDDETFERLEISQYVELLRKLDDKIQEENRNSIFWKFHKNIHIESDEYKKMVDKYLECKDEIEQEKENTKKMIEENEQLKKEIEDKQKEIDIKQREINSKQREIAQRDSTIIDRDTQLKIIANSRSWKITKPLRAITNKMAKIKDIYNQVKYYKKRHGLKMTIKKCIYILKNGRAVNNLATETEKDAYQLWIQNNEPTFEELEKQKEHKFKISPKISLIVPMYNTPVNFFEELVESLRNQTYKNWELCLADGSNEKNEQLLAIINKDKRIKYKFLNENKQIAGNTNEAIKMATGDYIALFDHDDLLPEFSLFEIVKAINENPGVEFIYTDEDKIRTQEEPRFDPYFKPDFSPDTLRANNYICHFSVFKKEIMDKLGGEREGYNGAQDYDLILRMSEIVEPKNIVHIPKILYHWRVHKQSTAATAAAKPYAFENGIKAIQDHIDRIGLKGKVRHGITLGTYKIDYEIAGNPKVSIVIPNKDGKQILEVCINSILKLTTYSNYEIIVVENNSDKKETFEYYKEIEKNEKIKVVYYPEKGFNYSKIINFGVKNSDGEYIIQLNNDTELITPNWIEEMLGFAQRDDVGGVGAKLLYPDGTVQHAGVVIGIGGIAGHILKNLPRDNYGYFSKSAMVQNMSGVTAACIMTKKSIYDEVGYMDEKLAVAFNDVDFCLKIRQTGKLIVFNPFVEFWHYESKTRGYEDNPEKVKRFQGEIDTFKSKWQSVLDKGDPYFNPNFRLDNDQYAINPNRISK